MPIPSLRDIEPDLRRILHEEGGLGAILLDMVALPRVERRFGQNAYQTLRGQTDPVIEELKNRIRREDLVARDERDADRVLLFLSRRRNPSPTLSMADVRRLADRIEQQIGQRVSRLTQPYLREKGAVDVGYGFVVWSPLESDDRQVQRVVEECVTSAALRRRLQERDHREALIEIVCNREVWTAFQPIVEIETQRTVGHEGLSRGPRGSDVELPMILFGLAHRFGLTEELERACRRKAFQDWETYGAPGRLFLNTVPATVRDPSFLGNGVLDYLGPNISPRLVTLEINERQVIENLTLYREAMHSFLELGFTFAIDDVGAGYSGLETMATLGASYLKIDMGLVRHVHQKRVSQQVIKAIAEMGAGVKATVIAEGIETQEEADALRALGVRYGQGYFFGRPVDPFTTRFRQTVRT